MRRPSAMNRPGRRDATPAGDQPDLDWVVVGGGIHGVHVAVRLVEAGAVAPGRLRIVDPGQALLSRWRECASRTGMVHLRSPVMHHLDVDPYSLHRFAEHAGTTGVPHYTEPNNRPSLELFNAHCEAVVERYGLGEVHVRARATSVVPRDGGVDVRLEGGRPLAAGRVVLALGAADRLRWPDWAPRDDPRVQHIFAGRLERPTAPGSRVAVVGGGITAAQVAVDRARRGQRVDLISRHGVREHQYDSDPGWFGPLNMDGFQRLEDPSDRRRAISQGRNRGSVPPDVIESLRLEIDAGRVVFQVARVTELRAPGTGLDLILEGAPGEARQVAVDEVLLSTGYAPERPGGALVDDLVADAGLPVAACGYPIVDGALRWHPRIHVTGSLAELELGPIARNIAGARRAGDRIVAAALEDGSAGPDPGSAYRHALPTGRTPW